MIEHRMLLRRIESVLPRYSYRFASEAQLHEGIAQALTDNGIAFLREFRASATDRFDFLCGDVVIEAKVDGSMPAALRQIDRYMQLEQCAAIVIAATKQWARGHATGFEVRGKPVCIVQLRPQAF